MRQRRLLREIRGTVFEDTNNNGMKDKSEQGLKDIIINLFMTEKVVDRGTPDDGDSLIYREKMIYRTKSNEKGEYSIIVNEGIYSLNLDINTLPPGKGVAEPDKLVDTGIPGNADFAVRDAAADASTIKAQSPINIKLAEICSTDKIHLACRAGIIDEKSKILMMLKAMFSKEKLPEDYRSRIPVKCGTWAAEEIMNYIGRKDADREVVETARRYLSSAVPKLNREFTSPSGFFKIHYTTTGTNAVQVRSRNPAAVPPYIELIGSTLDNVKAVTCGERGFRTPILEEGSNALDVYVYDLNGKYGVTYASELYENEGNNTKIASCYICLDNNYSSSKGFDKSRDDCMKVTAAHEFFHAVQYAYNVDADSWWKEASATWNEDELYTGVNDYIRYLDRYFSSPQNSLEESSYGGVVFAKYLSENYGGYEIIKRIWEVQSAAENSSVNSIDRTITERNGDEDIGSVFNRFTAYNFNPAQYYKEGSFWKTGAAIQNTYSSYPVALAKGKLDHLAASYVVFKPSSKPEEKTLRITVDGADGARWGIKVQKRQISDDKCYLTEITPNNEYSRVEIIIKNPGSLYKEICLVPANLEKEKNNLQYTYSATYSS